MKRHRASRKRRPQSTGRRGSSQDGGSGGKLGKMRRLLAKACSAALHDPRLPLACGIFLFFLIFIKNAWVAEDAFITFRTIEQFFDGNGLRWNPHERVQVSSSVLWVFLLLFTRMFSSDLFVNSIVLATVLCAGTLHFAWRMIGNAGWWLAAVVVLTASKGFMDYSSAGMENPLSYLVIALFALCYLQAFNPAHPKPAVQGASDSATGHRAMTRLTLVVSAVPLVRHDLALLVAPAYAYAWLYAPAMRGSRIRGRARLALIAAAPLLAWSLFSLFYYGHPLPNTALSKLNVQLPRSEVLFMGVGWLYANLRSDPISPLLLLACAGMLARDRVARPVGLGALLVLCYSVWIGGDYMLGRFLGVPLFLVVIVAAALQARKGSPGPQAAARPALIAVAAGLLYAALMPYSPLKSPLGYSKSQEEALIAYGIRDEKASNHFITSLNAILKHPDFRSYYGLNPHFVREFQNLPAGTLLTSSGDGKLIYLSGLDKISISYSGLTDPFLARLPFTGHRSFQHQGAERRRFNPLNLPLQEDGYYWWPGHLFRILPDGYPEAVVDDTVRLADDDLQQYWEKVRLVTQGDLLDWQRILTAIRLSFGTYDHLLASAEGKKADYEVIEFPWIIYDKDEKKWFLPSGRKVLFPHRPF